MVRSVSLVAQRCGTVGYCTEFATQVGPSKVAISLAAQLAP